MKALFGAPPEAKVPNSKRAKEFLVKNPLAKIIILVDTHSCQDGMIISGERGGYFYSEYLGNVRV